MKVEIVNVVALINCIWYFFFLFHIHLSFIRKYNINHLPNKLICAILAGVTEKIEQLKTLRDSTSELKNRYLWLRDNSVDSLAIDNAKLNYQKAWNLYRKIDSHGTPQFKRKSYIETYQTNLHYKAKDEAHLNNSNVKLIDERHMQLPKLGRIRVKGSKKRLRQLFELDRKQEIRIGTLTITRDGCGDYYVSMQLASDEPFVKPFEKTGSKIGIDLNVENFYADSFGNIVDNPRYYKKNKRRLKNAQRKLSRRITRAKKENRSLTSARNVQNQRKIVAELTASVYESVRKIVAMEIIKHIEHQLFNPERYFIKIQLLLRR